MRFSITSNPFPGLALACALTALAACTHAMAPAKAPAQGLAKTAASAPASAYTLTLRVEGVRSAKGQLRAELLGRAPGEKAHKRVTFGVQDAAPGVNLMRFENLSAGDYAVQLYHDENGNGKVDMNVLGVPQEGYGFSNVPVVQGGIPPFDRMKVTLAADASATAVLVYQP
ncbi:uncharacterized protein (DUF2141 family) [Caulobacter sp. BE264]|uniref:DUF2141 domain-containing protein n=1 Tax=Caulobacter sp. BE264 TaxID=2817724 RepID=UPI0028638A37|nr:DUF2141 domain-containing protein [Caulobacter sp. BE264]MDR7232772.1 uncharacterized protein (DUF2141 family) [Caulobacter sp. BE264]